MARVDFTSKHRKKFVSSHSTLDWKLKASKVRANRRPTMIKMMI